MGTIVAYMVVFATAPNALIEEVNKHIKEGWQPWGSFTSSEYRKELNQPMVKYAIHE